MTNNKHKEIIEKTLDKICEETSFIRGLDYDDEKLDYIGKCISSALTEQLEELEGWVKWIEIPKDNSDYELAQLRLREHILSHIREKKEIINKK